ncbi:MAG TPA: asparagine--tRNA ligase [Desulfosalsimonadaceae bacterium]|nr:asparagine--tRNA ligase [Desulfosalsimonadaceae bacterium]
MKRSRIKELLAAAQPPESIRVCGWVRTRRDSRDFSFLELNDGSCLENLQIVADAGIPGYEHIKNITTGAALAVSGRMQPSPGEKQNWELHAGEICLLGKAPENYPLQKKRHSDEFLRTIAHLRPRTNKYGAAFRIRSELCHAVHRFFRERGFTCIHTPILTGLDCEGAGELFRVTSLDMDSLPQNPGGGVDYGRDFFEKPANLTVSGQLEAEMMALALGDVYTFGPAFRAENSNTSRHMAEFWMVEPEMAFCDLFEAMDNAEAFIQYTTAWILESCSADLTLFNRFVDKSLLKTLEPVAASGFIRIPYKEAVSILAAAEGRFSHPVHFGADLQTEHERFLAETHFGRPLIVYDYPRSIKPFYMRVNDDGETVAAMDLIVPRIGEIIGGSQREERLDVLESRMEETGMNKEEYWWYLDSRRYGSVVHSGYGLGFERFLMLLTGIRNIRDVIAFPRTPGNLEF